jgi:GNAT superfamily N-acetyltransferase
MDEIQIQRATSHELSDLVPLFAGYLAFYGKPAEPTRIATFLGERLRGGQSVVFLAYRGDSAVGFVQLYPVFSSLALAPAWLLNDLFVAPQARGAGIAQRLMEAARGLAEDTGASELQLQTARDNLPAQRLYERLGYRRDDVFLVYGLDLQTG